MFIVYTEASDYYVHANITNDFILKSQNTHHCLLKHHKLIFFQLLLSYTLFKSKKEFRLILFSLPGPAH